MENDQNNAKEDPNEELKDEDAIEKSLPLALETSSTISTNSHNLPGKQKIELYFNPCYAMNNDRHKLLGQKNKLPPFKKLGRYQDRIDYQFKCCENALHDLKPLIRIASFFVSINDC